MERIEDLTYKAQQRQRQGRTIEAIRLFEQALEYRIDLHGPESSSVKKSCENLSDLLNGTALKHLQNEEYEEAKKLLQKAEMLTGPDDLISATTYNNIACYYRRKNKLRTALKYLEKAQRIEMKSQVVANPAGTRLNLCAVLSQLDRHGEALEHAQAAVVLLQEELAQMELDNGRWEQNPEKLNKMAVLAISYHNIGVEEEYLKRHAASLAAYKKGVQIAREYLGQGNDITRTLIKSCHAAQEHLDNARMKKGFSPPSIIRQGESMGGAYDALQQHNSIKRRAQSAGSQRSQSATPSWAMEGDRSLQRPSTAHTGAGSRSLSRTRAWVDESGNDSTLGISSMFDKGPLKSSVGDRSSRVANNRDDYAQAYKRNGPSDDYKEMGLGSRGINGRRRPASALGIVDDQTDNNNNNWHAPELLEPLSASMGGSMGARRGPRTPRLDEGDQKVPAIRRPPSASLRQPVRTNLGTGIERENLATQLKRVDEEQVKQPEKTQENKAYAWEELNGLDVDDDDEDFLDDQFQDPVPSNRRVTYERPGGQASTGRSSSRPRDSSASRPRDGCASSASDSSAARTGERGHADSRGDWDGGGRGVNENGNGHGRRIQLGPLDDDLLDDDCEDGEVDVDSATEEFIQDSKVSAGQVRGATRPASASLSRPREAISRDGLAPRNTGRPASASIAVIQERRQRDRAKRPASAAPGRSNSDTGAAYQSPQGKLSDRGEGISRQNASDSKPGVGRELDYPMPGISDKRASLRPASASAARPASASVARPMSASVTRPGSARPATSSVHARPASASMTRPISHDARQDEMARNMHREEREILDILSDHSEYESDLELQAEAMAMRSPPHNTNQRRQQNSSMAADPSRSRNTYDKPDTSSRRPQRPQDGQRCARPDDRGLDARRAELLAKTDIGLDHSDYESEDGAAGRGGRAADRNSAAREDSRDRYPALEQLNARINDQQYDDRQVVGQQVQRHTDSKRPQRPSDNKRAPNRSSRPSDSQRPSRGGRKDLRDVTGLSDDGEFEAYERNDDATGANSLNSRHKLDDMSGTLKWLEDGLSTRND